MPNKLGRAGMFFCLCGPAGVGKTVLGQELLQAFSNLKRSLSATSRKPRGAEVEGEAYRFLSREQFEGLAKTGQFFEWEEVHGNFYGTPKEQIEAVLSDRHDLLLIIDVKGALNFKRKFADRTVIAFIVAPSLAELEKRMRARGDQSESDLVKRLQTAKAEYAALQADLKSEKLIDYIVENKSLQESLSNLKFILQAESLKAKRLSSDSSELLS